MDHGRIHMLQVLCAGADHHRLQLAACLLKRLPDTVFRYLRAIFKTPVMTADEDKRMK